MSIQDSKVICLSAYRKRKAIPPGEGIVRGCSHCKKLFRLSWVVAGNYSHRTIFCPGCYMGWLKFQRDRERKEVS